MRSGVICGQFSLEPLPTKIYTLQYLRGALVNYTYRSASGRASGDEGGSQERELSWEGLTSFPYQADNALTAPGVILD